MRWQLLLLLALSGLAFAPTAQSLPRSTPLFTLGWTRIQVDSALAARNVEATTTGHDFIATPGETPEVEYLEYNFIPTAHGSALLWKVTYGYRVPYDREVFEGAKGTLIGDLGQPDEEHHSDVKAGDLVDKLTWADAATVVQLGARWSEHQDPSADRMLVTWIDRRLQKMASVQNKKAAKKK